MFTNIALESLLASLLIDSHEGRALQTSDLPRAYIRTSLPNDNIVPMKFEGEFLDITCEVNPKYEKCVTYEKGKGYCMC